jgi:phage shock protein C
MQRRLFRSKHNRVLLGVCGGIGEYFDTDPVIIRIITVLLIIAFNFLTIIAYFIMALVIPLEGSASATPRDSIRENVEDLKETGTGIGEEIRTAFQKPPAPTGVPGQPPPFTSPPHYHTDSNRALLIVGLIIIIIGIFFLLTINFGWIWGKLWPIILIVVGLKLCPARY